MWGGNMFKLIEVGGGQALSVSQSMVTSANSIHHHGEQKSRSEIHNSWNQRCSERRLGQTRDLNVRERPSGVG